MSSELSFHEAQTAQAPFEVPRQTLPQWIPAALLVHALLTATYFVARFGRHWAEADTGSLSLAIRSVADGGSITGTSAFTYANGFGYAAVSHAVLAFTGLTVSALQQVVYPLVTALIVFPAWCFYKEVSGSGRIAGLAVLLLFVQPEFLFVVMRGSHERVLRFSMFIAFWLLVRSHRFRDRPSAFASHVLLFYMVAFGLVITNTLFGLSFNVALTAALSLSWLVGSWRRPGAPAVAAGAAGRLALIAVAVSAIAFVSIFYVYPPAIHSVQQLSTLGRTITNVVLTTQPASNPYAQVVEGWTSTPVYFIVSAGNYLLLGGSALAWVWMGVSWLTRRERPTHGAWMLWLLYAAFAAQGALAIFVDRSGMFSGNLQHRSFPSFAMVATPIMAILLGRLRFPVWPRVAGGVSLAVLSSLALVKVTNEPSLSNKWTFYAPAELRAMQWADARTRGSTIWVGVDERLAAAYAVGVGSSVHRNRWDIFGVDQGTRMLLVSDLLKLQAARLRRPLPVVGEENLIYDGGGVRIYRLRPRTAFQR